jgi:hypothetical protein
MSKNDKIHIISIGKVLVGFNFRIKSFSFAKIFG